MTGYSPLKITGYSVGLVNQREEFLLPNDAYPRLQNAYVWRERIKRKKGYQLLGRLRRNVTGNLGNTDGGGAFSGNIIAILGLEATASLVPGAFTATVGAVTITEPATPNGTLLFNGIAAGVGNSINWATGALTLAGLAPATAINADLDYYPGLPVMGIRTREIIRSSRDETIFFDQVYAYRFNNTTSAFEEFIPGKTWNASGQPVSGTDFFWSTNYWVSSLTLPGTAIPFFTTPDQKLFWVTNNTGRESANSDPIRITDGVTWVDFVPPNFGQIDAAPTYLVNCLSFLPFRGRMLAFNTWEGGTIAGAQNYSNRIRWSTIGSPFVPFSAGPPALGSWRDDIRGQGGFLDIPTSEDIIAVGFVRDNLVIYCERSTWQLRYTGRSIAPFQVEKINSELGSESPFSAVQFDTSLVGIGDKGIVECDSYKSDRIDIKIPDFVFQIPLFNNGPFRIQGARDFINRLAFWTIPFAPSYDPKLSQNSQLFPNQRLIYNYENDSWALFNDSLTALGTYQPQSSRTWLNTEIPWDQCNFTWIDSGIAGIPAIVGGNQQGFVEYLDILTVNDVSLYIKDIIPNGDDLPAVIVSPNHNMSDGFVIEISGIPTGTPYASLNGGVFGIILGDLNGVDPANKFRIMTYNDDSREFSTPADLVPSGTYVGGGLIKIRENFSIVSKKFNFLDEGQSIQMGFIDILMEATEREDPGAISLNVYIDYNENEASNTPPQNEINDYSVVSNPDTFFNSVIPTTSSTLNNVGGSKFWQRVFCATRANFLTLEYTFSNAQLAGGEQTKNVQIDAQVLWVRRSGRLSQI